MMFTKNKTCATIMIVLFFMCFTFGTTFAEAKSDESHKTKIIWEADSIYRGVAQGIEWTPDGNYIISSYSADNPTLIKWDAKTGEVILEADDRKFTTAMDISQNGELVVIALSEPYSHFNTTGKMGNGRIEVRDINTFSTIWEFDNIYGPGNFDNDSTITDISWSSDGNYLAWTGPNDGVVIWDYTNQSLVTQIKSLKGGGVEWSTVGLDLAISNAEKLGIYDLESGKIQNISGLEGKASVSAIDWSHDGKKIAIGDNEGHFIVVETSNWTNIFKSEDILNQYNGTAFITNNSIYNVKWSHDSSKLAVSSIMITLTIWNTDNWNLAQIITNRDSAREIAWSPEKDNLAFGSSNIIVYRVYIPDNTMTYVAVGSISSIAIVGGYIGVKKRKKGVILEDEKAEEIL